MGLRQKFWIVQYLPARAARWYSDSRHSSVEGANFRMDDLRKDMHFMLHSSRVVCIEELRYENYLKEKDNE